MTATHQIPLAPSLCATSLHRAGHARLRSLVLAHGLRLRLFIHGRPSTLAPCPSVVQLVIVMPTPPITLIDFVKKVKKKTGAKFYMVLRDIHPQSSASLGEIKRQWMIDYLYRRSDLGYRLADVVGCMSQANIDFIQKEHRIPSTTKCRVLYNWMNYQPYVEEDFSDLREKYNLKGKFLVLFGGNIGQGQRVENIADLAKHYLSDKNVVFVIIGKGIKKDYLQQLAKEQGLDNILFLNYMPREDYLRFVKSADLGLISIHEKNAAPTCPSKALSYMSLKSRSRLSIVMSPSPTKNCILT